MSEYNTEDKISREFDPDIMVGLSEKLSIGIQHVLKSKLY